MSSIIHKISPKPYMFACCAAIFCVSEYYLFKRHAQRMAKQDEALREKYPKWVEWQQDEAARKIMQKYYNKPPQQQQH